MMVIINTSNLGYLYLYRVFIIAREVYKLYMVPQWFILIILLLFILNYSYVIREAILVLHQSMLMMLSFFDKFMLLDTMLLDKFGDIMSSEEIWSDDVGRSQFVQFKGFADLMGSRDNDRI